MIHVAGLHFKIRIDLCEPKKNHLSTAVLTWIITSPFITEPCFGSGDGGFSIAGN